MNCLESFVELGSCPVTRHDFSLLGHEVRTVAFHLPAMHAGVTFPSWSWYHCCASAAATLGRVRSPLQGMANAFAATSTESESISKRVVHSGFVVIGKRIIIISSVSSVDENHGAARHVHYMQQPLSLWLSSLSLFEGRSIYRSFTMNDLFQVRRRTTCCRCCCLFLFWPLGWFNSFFFYTQNLNIAIPVLSIFRVPIVSHFCHFWLLTVSHSERDWLLLSFLFFHRILAQSSHSPSTPSTTIVSSSKNYHRLIEMRSLAWLPCMIWCTMP